MLHLVSKYHVIENYNYWHNIISLLLIFNNVEKYDNNYINKREYESNKIEIKDIRVKKSIFERYESNLSIELIIER